MERKRKKSEYQKSISRPVSINGVSYDSCLEAAKFIVSEMPDKNKSTIAKELRKFANLKRPGWCMYGLYTVSL